MCAIKCCHSFVELHRHRQNAVNACNIGLTWTDYLVHACVIDQSTDKQHKKIQLEIEWEKIHSQNDQLYSNWLSEPHIGRWYNTSHIFWLRYS